MPWVVGIDEAGYGPVLGPLVQAVVVLWLPPEDTTGWNALRSMIRQARESPDERVLITDSKAVYSRYGLDGLESGIVRSLHMGHQTLDTWIKSYVMESSRQDWQRERWFDGSEVIPRRSWESPLCWPFPAHARVRLLTPAAFNRSCDQTGNKAAVLGQGWIELVRSLEASPSSAPLLIPQDGQDIVIYSDKLGGRHFYWPMLLECFVGRWVTPLCEKPHESRYRIDGGTRAIDVQFSPRAEASSLVVALASMLAKYVREIWMGQFQRFWQRHIPNLDTTGGYLPHARQWYARIAPLLAEVGVHPDEVWRRR
jgi:ribonuclease HII